jgi:hypothetical protein
MTVTRDIAIERLYFIANYQNIKIDSKINNLPAEIANNPEVIDRLYYVLMLNCDIAYKKYMDLRQKIASDKVKDILEMLKEEREIAQTELNEKFGVTLETQITAVEEKETK